MREQYLRLKQQYPDAILLFRLGDFYETFDEDAKTVAQVCGITLTSRPVGKDVRAPLAGVPYQSLDTYLARLLRAGHRVAIAEQTASDDKDLMRRDVVRVVTPGTITEEQLLLAGSNNYLATLVTSPKVWAVAYADISTGEFVAEERAAEDVSGVRDVLARLSPAECVTMQGDDAACSLVAESGIPSASIEAWRAEPLRARELLLRHFAVSTLEPFGLDGRPELTQAAALCLLYLQETQPSALAALQTLRVENDRRYMHLDRAALRNLGVLPGGSATDGNGSLLAVLDQTRTAMGARLLRQRLLRPLLAVEALAERLDGVESFFRNDLLRSRLRDALREMPDLERLGTRLEQGDATPRHLLGIAAASRCLGSVRSLLGDCHELGGEALEAARALDPCDDAAELIRAAIADDAPNNPGQPGVIRQGYSQELDALLDSASHAQEVLARLEASERERTGIRNLRLGHNNVFGYYIEVPKSQVQRVPPDYVRKQTIAAAERYFNPEIKAIEAEILSAQERRLALEHDLWADILDRVSKAAPRLIATARALAILDVDAALAEVARVRSYTRPQLDEGTDIDIVAGRHPVVEVSLERSGMGFVPNDVHLSNNEEAILVITGPNMAGKSTYLRQVALIVLLAHVGAYVPAQSAHIGLVDRIFTRIGAQDDLAAGQSTFMVEMVEVASILRQATPRSLVILDEVGRGTSTYDGMAIARAVIEQIHNSQRLGCKTLFATHYHELVDLEQYLPRVRNYSVAVAEEGGNVVFLHRIVRGGADRSYGVHVAKLAGVPREVLERAEQVLAQLESQRQVPTQPPERPLAARQLDLFSPAGDELVSELSRLQTDELTPLEALNLLSVLSQRARDMKTSQHPGRRTRP